MKEVKEVKLFKEIRALAKIYPNDSVFAFEVRKIIQTVINEERIKDAELSKEYAKKYDEARSKNLYKKLQKEKQKFEKKIIESNE